MILIFSPKYFKNIKENNNLYFYRMCSICLKKRNFYSCKIVTECGHTFCRFCLLKWLRTKEFRTRTCPVCRKNLQNDYEKICNKKLYIQTRLHAARNAVLNLINKFESEEDVHWHTAP